MTLDQIDRMVRQANPVSDLTALEPVDASVLDELRRMDMQTKDRVIVDDEGEEPRQGRNLLIGIAAAVAIIVGALLLLRPLTDETPVANNPTTPTEALTTTSPVEIATAFLEAYAAHDVDQAASFLAPEALSEFGGTLESMRLEVAWNEASGFKVLPGTCEEANRTPTDVVVQCFYDFYGIRAEEMDLGPYTGSSYVFTVRDRQISLVRDLIAYQMNGFRDEIWGPFADWVAGTYPDDVIGLYEDQFQSSSRISEESIPLWEQRSREYVEVVEQRKAEAILIATSFIDAFSSFDVDQAGIYLAPSADLSRLDLLGASWPVNNALMEAMGWKLQLDTCEARDAAGTTVTCPFANHMLHSDEMDLGPFGQNLFEITVEDGLIVSAAFELGFSTNGFDSQVWRPFTKWIEENHPDDGAVMLSGVITEESIALWEQRSREYVEAVLAGQ